MIDSSELIATDSDAVVKRIDGDDTRTQAARKLRPVDGGAGATVRRYVIRNSTRLVILNYDFTKKTPRIICCPA